MALRQNVNATVVGSPPTRGINYFPHCPTLVQRKTAALSFDTRHAMSLAFGGKWDTDCLSTRLPLPTLLHAGYSVKLTTMSQVFINRTRRILLLSSDGRVAQWRCAPSFESNNHYIAGAPLTSRGAALVSVVTARCGSHYAVSTLEVSNNVFYILLMLGETSKR